MLIVSDEYNEDLINLFETVASRVVMWKPIRAPDGLLIDMLACVPAIRFFGSPLSTFSAGIVQYRNRLRPDIHVQYTMPYSRTMQQLPSWARAGEIYLPAPLAPVFKDVGYETVRTHHELSNVLRDLYDDSNVGFTYESPKGVIGDSMIKKISDSWKYRIDLMVKPLLEQWSGIKLKIAKEPIAFRRFLRNSYLPSKSLGHSLAIIINIIDRSNQPFTIEADSRDHGSWVLDFDTDYMLLIATGYSRANRLDGDEFVDIPIYYDAVDLTHCNGLCGNTSPHDAEL